MTPDQFLETQTFYCSYLRCNLTPKSCASRQVKSGGRGGFSFTKPRVNLASSYCRSGHCELGKKIEKLVRRHTPVGDILYEISLDR